MNPIQQKQTARYIGYQACQSLIEEAMTTPKPGLVDQNNNGAHTDMCLQTFLTVPAPCSHILPAVLIWE